MLWLYNFGIYFYRLLIKLFATFNLKAKLFDQGRENLFDLLEKKMQPGEKHIWFHFASLGEFEQGRPVLEKIRKNYPEKKIIMTFFSPSGYEIRKNYPLADAVFYLPLDTAAHAKAFISLVNPEIAVFTKYEFWYHYFKTLHDRHIPLFLISGIFRPGQTFFKWYGGFYRKMLDCVTHFFVQNEESVRLLNSIHVNQVTLSGDTRFDRVFENASAPKKIDVIASFVQQAPVLVAGSTWPQDEALIARFIQKHPDWKLIIAPHEIHAEHIHQIEKLFPSAVKYSNLGELKNSSRILIMDNIGLLSALYQYGSIAYIGGGFGTGIHNTLEAAAFGLPVIFGPKYDKFQEAKDLLAIGAARSIHNEATLEEAFQNFIQHPAAGDAAKKYVRNRKGATDGIFNELKKYLA